MTMNRSRATVWITAGAVLALGGATLWARQSPQPIPVFKTSVELVTVDVGVVDRQGQPMRGLAAGDFTVTVAGQPRRVVSAEFVDTAAARVKTVPGEPASISTNDGAGLGRLFVFVVDQGTLEPGNVRHVARAASRFFENLSFVDRSALMLLPAGPNVNFTWAHDRVRDALGKVVGQSANDTAWEFGSLSEARDIANRSLLALRNVGQRECGRAIGDPFGGSSGGAPAPSGPSQGTGATGGTQGGGTQGGGTGGGAAGGGSSQGSGGGGGGGGTTSRSSSGGGGGLGGDGCTRDLQMRAEWAWRGAQMTSQTSVNSFRQLLSALERVRGDKTIILISGGWPLDDREQHTLMSTVASEAAAARATLYTLFVPGSAGSASRRMMSATPANDSYLQSSPLDTLASMTGGSSFRAEVGADAVFARLSRELSGFYRIGVEKDASDADGKGRRMKVQVARPSITVRAREVFDARTYDDRDWAARLSSALEAPIPATAVALRVTSYLTADPEDASRVRIVLSGEASRLDPGEATVQLLVRNLEGTKLLAGEQPIGEPRGDGLAFTANVPVAPGGYVLRVAVIDGAGRVGSVDHRIDAHRMALGPLTASAPLLLRVPAPGRGEPRLAVDTVRQDERLAVQIDLDGDRAQLQNTEVDFEIATSADGPSLVHTSATLASNRSGSMLAQGVSDMRVLPPGSYFARAKVTSGTAVLGEVRRPFTLMAAALPPDTVVAGASAAGSLAPRATVARAVAKVPPFAVDHVTSPQVLGAFLDRVSARPDAASPMIRDLVRDARANIGQLYVSDVLAAQSPVAAFLKGVSLLSQNKLELAANSFRSAMRASADFYPAMIYLGACYAAGGNDKEATGAWRTALIKEGDALPLHTLLADALLRQDNGELALETLDKARSRWPDDDGIKRRFVLAALMAGEYADGLQTLDELVERHMDDEPSLATGLLVLYEAFHNGKPIVGVEQDRARMVKLADAYRARGGPSLALIDTWLAAAKK
jgi:VWFA-related protein